MKVNLEKWSSPHFSIKLYTYRKWLSHAKGPDNKHWLYTITHFIQGGKIISEGTGTSLPLLALSCNGTSCADILLVVPNIVIHIGHLPTIHWIYSWSWTKKWKVDLGMQQRGGWNVRADWERTGTCCSLLRCTRNSHRRWTFTDSYVYPVTQRAVPRVAHEGDRKIANFYNCDEK